MVKLNANVHPSLSEMVTKNLRRKNVVTTADFIATDPIKLATFIGVPYTDILQLKEHILKKFGSIKRNATELLAMERNCIIPTNITWYFRGKFENSLDDLLKGGLYPGQLCELCGLSSSGKTQLCLTIAANAIIRPDIVAWYFDTKRDFSRVRYEEILRTRNFGQKAINDALQRTKICYVYSSQELIRALRQLVTCCKTGQNSESLEGRKPLLVIIDSLPAVIFKITRKTRHDLETTYELNDLAETCRFLTRDCHAVVITVNLVTQWDSPKQIDRASITPALGKYWENIPATRLLLTRQHGETRKITVWKDLRLCENSYCIVTVNDSGITAQ